MVIKVCRPVKMLLTSTFMSLFSQASCEAGFNRGLGSRVLESLFPQRGHLPAPQGQGLILENHAGFSTLILLFLNFLHLGVPVPAAAACFGFCVGPRPAELTSCAEGGAALGSVLLGLPVLSRFPHRLQGA